MSVRTALSAKAAHPGFVAVVILAALTAIRIAWLASGPFDLYPDEAQYWIWAQHPAFGYFSKPPVVAWMITATTTLFGDSVAAIKLSSPITYFLTSLMIYALGARLFTPRLGAWSAIAFATLPAVWLSAAIISTDVPLLLFWAAATYGLVRARESSRPAIWWLLVGVVAGLGLLAKYAMGFWIGSALLFLLAVKEERRRLLPFLGAVLLACVIALPNLLWNRAHAFITFKSTSDTTDVHGFSLQWRAFLDFALSQFGVFGPIFFGVFLIILWRRRDWTGDRRLQLLAALSAPTLAVMIAESMLSRAHANWSAPAFVTATVLVVERLAAWGRMALVKWSIGLHSAIMVLGYGALAASHALGHPPPAKLDPLRQVLGYRELGAQLSELVQRNPDTPLLGDDRMIMAEMIYYIRPHPFQMRKWNPQGGAEDTFDLTQSLPGRPGGDYLWITEWPARGDIVGRFQSHRLMGQASVTVDPGGTRTISLVALQGFKGYATAAKEKR